MGTPHSKGFVTRTTMNLYLSLVSPASMELRCSFTLTSFITQKNGRYLLTVALFNYRKAETKNTLCLYNSPSNVETEFTGKIDTKLQENFSYGEPCFILSDSNLDILEISPIQTKYKCNILGIGSSQ